MSSRLIIYIKNAGGREDVWWIDAYVHNESGELDLYRSGEYVVTLRPDDYCNGLVIEEWDGEARTIEPLNDFDDIEEDEDGDVYVNITLPTVH